MSKLAGTSQSIRTPSPHEITRDYIRLQRLQRLPQITGDYQRLPEIELAIVIYHKLY
ncbi:predicted protein [Botrytis cinerea T4]|uniref:Uncharacterized protein n=1 Tax=Botryotinia fuckeliana (strain T4) TaxID=999810 RepID=G2YT78_BOTF4|nr:predicted protein [Botrytis cinerea T4]